MVFFSSNVGEAKRKHPNICILHQIHNNNLHVCPEPLLYPNTSKASYTFQLGLTFYIELLMEFVADNIPRAAARSPEN